MGLRGRSARLGGALGDGGGSLRVEPGGSAVLRAVAPVANYGRDVVPVRTRIGGSDRAMAGVRRRRAGASSAAPGIG